MRSGFVFDRQVKFGVFSFLLSVFLIIVLPDKLDSLIFVLGLFYGLVTIFHRKIEELITPIVSGAPLVYFAILIFVGGMLAELLAYASNLGRITAGEEVFLFSPNLLQDLVIGFPHYVSLGLVWMLLVKRYRLSAFQQGLLIWLFWGIVVDNFSHLLALLSGNILDFVIAGLILVFALNWPLVLMQDILDERYPFRKSGWTKYIIGFTAQIIPMIVLYACAITLNIFVF